MDPSQNLKKYASTARIPYFDFTKGNANTQRRSQFVWTRAEDLPRLITIRQEFAPRLKKTRAESWLKVKTEAHDFVLQYLPDKPVAISDMKSAKFLLPTPVSEFRRIECTRTIETITQIVETCILETVTTICSMAFPQTVGSTFALFQEVNPDGRPDAEEDVLSSLNLTLPTLSNLTERVSLERGGSPIFPMRVFIVPPWILKSDLFQVFVSPKNHLPQLRQLIRTANHSPKMRFIRNLWHKISDRCMVSESHFFILTSYNEWAFGAFSNGWTQAFITPKVNRAAADNDIFKAIVYWTASALGHPAGYSIQGVRENASQLIPPINYFFWNTTTVLNDPDDTGDAPKAKKPRIASGSKSQFMLERYDSPEEDKRHMIEKWRQDDFDGTGVVFSESFRREALENEMEDNGYVDDFSVELHPGPDIESEDEQSVSSDSGRSFLDDDDKSQWSSCAAPPQPCMDGSNIWLEFVIDRPPLIYDAIL